MPIWKSFAFVSKSVLITSFTFIGTIVITQAGLAQQIACRIAPTSEISSIDQAKCLLRSVRRYGQLGPTLPSLPSSLDRLLSLRVIDLDQNTLRQYLLQKGIQESAIGGSLDNPVSRSNNNSASAEPARYFVIHDTSTPNFLNQDFPDNINNASWVGNSLQRWLTGSPRAHVFINRIGASVTAVDFKTPWRATGFELETCGTPCKGMFLNVELIQPRKRDPQGGANNDAIAPVPGFTDSQLDRLALTYIAASVRRGKWLIPVFHASLDAGISGAHDDPQNFDLERWTNRLNDLLTSLHDTP